MFHIIANYRTSFNNYLKIFNVADHPPEGRCISLRLLRDFWINFEHAQLAGKLPLIHKDPFDRMLIAQTILEKLTLVSNDQLIAQYDVKLLHG